jgi:hypothetical protein
VGWPVQDHVDAFLTLARAATGSPSLVVLDGEVPNGTVAPYALVYFYVETPDGLMAPDKISLTLASSAINCRAYVHAVGDVPQAPRAARGVAGRFRNAVLDKTLSVPGWSCFPVRWLEGQPPQRNDDIPGSTVFDQVDVYGWAAVAG